MHCEVRDMENGTKLRLLYIYQYLLEHTDQEHPKSTVELIKMLKDKYDMKVARNTVCNDLIMLRNSNLHIEYIQSTQNKYYYDGQPFEVSELKILIDALSSAKFITDCVSQKLIAKLLTLTTEENAMQLSRHISVDGYIKSDSISGYYSVDTINNAINLHRKITLRYTDYDVHKQRYITNNGNVYTISPYELTWDGDYYYVRGYCDERQSMRTFRLDRIAEQPIVTNEIAVMPPENYNPSEYKRTVFRMFDTEEPVEVELLCDVSMMKYLIDNFGKDFKIEVINDNTFKAFVTVCTSLTFYRWIFGFTGKIQIVGPETIIRTYINMLTDAMNKYI